MKDANIGDFLLWEGSPAKVIGEINQRAVVIELLGESRCSHCGNKTGKHQFTVIPTSPLFQEKAQALPTIKND